MYIFKKKKRKIIYELILEMFLQKIKIKIRKIKSSKIIYIVGYFCRDVATLRVFIHV